MSIAKRIKLSAITPMVWCVDEAIEYPGLVWVKDPVDLDGNKLAGGVPRRRHHEDCWHFSRADDGSLLGPAPYRASGDQMRSLPPCQSCVETQSGQGAAGSLVGSQRRGEVCQTCFMERPLTGVCPNCGEE